MPFEILNLAFVLLGGFAGVEGAEVAAAAGLFIFLARIEAVFSGFEFSDHRSLPAKGGRAGLSPRP